MAETVAFLADNSRSIFIGSLAYFALLWAAIVIWTANDLSRRPASLKLKIFSLALVMVGNVFGFIVYLIIRPQITYEESRQEELERKFVENQMKGFYCKACEFPVKEDFLLCPNCLKKLKNVCSNCSHLMEVNWLACPFCGHNRLNLPTSTPAVNQLPIQDRGVTNSALQNGTVFEAPAKRGRGRPRKNPILVTSTSNSLPGENKREIETITLIGNSNLQPVKRGRGRPRKQSITSTEVKQSQAVTSQFEDTNVN